MLTQLYIAISFNILFYSIATILILLTYYKSKINVLGSQVNIIGSSGIVERPFSKYNCGKIKVKIKNNWQFITATTNEDRQFVFGDRILIFRMIDERALVIRDRYY